MTAAALNFQAVRASIDNVTAVQVTAAVDDGTGTGTFVRSILFFVDPGNAGLPAVAQIDIRSKVLTNIEIQTPQLNF